MQSLLPELSPKRMHDLAVSYQHPPYILEMELALQMQERNREKCRGILEQINLIERAQLSWQPLRSLQYSLVCECTCFTRTAIRAGVDSETAFDLSDLYIRAIDSAASVSRLLEAEQGMLDDFISLIELYQGKTGGEHPVIGRVMRHIRSNIHQPLDLDACAAFVGLHPTYLSALFKKTTGMSLRNYADGERMTAIRSFLMDTDLKMQEIADIFAFSSPAHFSAYFKKRAGVSPLKFRLSARQTG